MQTATPGPMMRVGVLGGTFDPPHAGHLALGAHFARLLDLDRLILIPAGHPWQKQDVSPAADRLAMTELAAALLREELGKDVHPARVEVSRMEIDRTGPSYTADTVKTLRAQLGAQTSIAWLMGADQLLHLNNWERWRDIFLYSHVCVASRPGHGTQVPNPAVQGEARSREADTALIQSRPSGGLLREYSLAVDLSSTGLRASLEQGRDTTGLLPASIAAYIKEHHLYRQVLDTRHMDLSQLQYTIVDALEDVKGQDIQVFDTIHMTGMFDRVIVASGTSNRQTRALAMSVRDKVKAAGGEVISVEGLDTGEWVLVDCGDAVVHIMQPMVRSYYSLEELWGDKKLPPKPVEKKAPAKKHTAKKVAPKEAVEQSEKAEKTPTVKKTPVKKPAAKRPAAKKAAVKKAAVKKPAVKKTPAKKAVVKKASAKTPARKAPAKKAPAQKAPVKKPPAKKAAKSVK